MAGSSSQSYNTVPQGRSTNTVSLFIHSSHLHFSVSVRNTVVSSFPSLQSLQMFKGFYLELPNLSQRLLQ